MDLVEIFNDTIDLCRSNPILIESIAKSKENQKFIDENEKIDYEKNRFEKDFSLVVSKTKSFETAKKYAQQGLKVAVLNFANSFNPGGGVADGAVAQEECLCRISTLYECLTAPEMVENFYSKHCAQLDGLANGDIIYTPDVKVFKADTSEPKLLDENQWFHCDVITCAAPCLGWGSSIDEKRLAKIHDFRARRILDAACSHKVDVVILGAFGCGAFSNPPDVVAGVYKNVLEDYKRNFRVVDFAIYCGRFETNNFIAFNKILNPQDPN